MMNMLKVMVFLPVAALLLASVALAGDDCLGCHEEKTPGAVRQWRGSAHGPAGIGCAECHGDDHERIESGQAPVEAKVCGRCHQEAFHQHTKSRHGMGLHSGWGCTRKLSGRDPGECRFCHEEGSTRPLSTVECSRFLKQTSEMGELGCNRCHQVESSCASCHTNHGTDLKAVRDPLICAKCHMGPDHPQWEMWQTSMHGTLHATSGESVGPSCQSCHMPVGTHDVSGGLTMTPGGELYPQEELAERRSAMIAVCTPCHGERFARRDLERGDAVRSQSKALVKEAEEILWDLADRGLLDPMPRDRPAHPLRGNALVTDSQMLYEDTSRIERLFFKMKKYDLAKTVKGAYHQNPAYTHWYGNAELKMDLIDIRAEASRLRERGKATPSTPGLSPAQEVERQLEILKKKFDRGAIGAREYEAEKNRLLDTLSGS
jgi:hypothetical protein